jgi:hypothetical protein
LNPDLISERKDFQVLSALNSIVEFHHLHKCRLIKPIFFARSQEVVVPCFPHETLNGDVASSEVFMLPTGVCE